MNYGEFNAMSTEIRKNNKTDLKPISDPRKNPNLHWHSDSTPKIPASAPSTFTIELQFSEEVFRTNYEVLIRAVYR